MTDEATESAKAAERLPKTEGGRSFLLTNKVYAPQKIMTAMMTTDNTITTITVSEIPSSAIAFSVVVVVVVSVEEILCCFTIYYNKFLFVCFYNIVLGFIKKWTVKSLNRKFMILI